MCGITGFHGHGTRADIERMTTRLVHRGPDDEGISVDEKARVSLGFRRLSIVDLAGGHQPMATPDRQLEVVFNGEIYNHAELRAQLIARGHQFATDHSDTEVLLHGYREWGEALPARLNGMWAFVIHDRKRGQLFGSRDRFGKKPLYYYSDPRLFAFASELASLTAHPGVPRELSTLSLQKYFAYCYVPAPRSIYQNIWKLPGGHSFTWDLAKQELRIARYWQFVLEPDIPAGDPEKIWCEQIRDRLERAVKRRLMSDVPLGVFLSGGIDSSAIAALAAKHTARLHTFSVGFDEPSFDETRYAELMARTLGTEHRTETLNLDNAVKLLPVLVSRLDEPFADSSLLPTYLLSRFTRQHVTVALGGDGGDELFAGYDPFRALKKAEQYRRFIPRPIHLAIRLIASRLPVSHQNLSLDFKIKRTLSGLGYRPQLWSAVWMGALEPDELSQLFREPLDIEEVYSEAIETWDECAQPNLVDRTLQFFTRLYLQDGILAKVDRASMLNSLEARSPFLDIEVADLARTIPHTWKLRHGQTKYILKKALEPLLPHEIVHRKKKGFGMPVGRWFRSGALDLAPLPAPLDETFTRDRLALHREGRSDERLFLWSAWLLGQWHRHHAPTG